ncbi:MAG: aminodeoxychorismate synthase component I [Planctomycetaceae bacterium]
MNRSVSQLGNPSNKAFVPLVEELTPTPDVEGALRLLSDQPNLLLLESCLKRENVGRYSFLMADPISFQTLPRVRFGEDPFASLNKLLQEFPTTSLPELPPFQGGVAGLAGYELGHVWEQIAHARYDEFQLPDMAVGIYDWVIAWGHERGQAWLISQGFPETEFVKREKRAQERLKWVRGLLNRSISSLPNRDHTISQSDAILSRKKLAPQHPVNGRLNFTSDFSREQYLKAVERVIEYIYAGDIFQANLSQRLLWPQDRSPLELYERLRKVNPAPFAGYFACDDWAIMSASPERFLRIEQGEVETRPIKGTRRRARGPEADLYRRDELRESEKDMAENVMIVDLLRNDLSRVCSPGSIRVPELCAVETYETVQHLVSEIRGKLSDGLNGWDLLAASFPGGSITGAPKVRAMEIISELEPTARGPYCGSLFYVGFDGRMDSSILIRTLICRHGWVQCPVGGGIVAQSDPRAEYEETMHKAEGMLRAF